MPRHLVEGESLLAGQSIPSQDGRFVTYMSTRGHVTLYRFEAGRDPVNMWRFYCYHQRVYGEPWMGIRNGFLLGGDHRYHDRPETAWWCRPRNCGGRNPSNPILVLQDDGNMVLYNRNDDGQITSAEWATRTYGSHPAAINPNIPVAMVSTGTITINANTLITNSLSKPISVSDGQTAIELEPNASIGAYSNNGPGTLSIDIRSFEYDLDEGSSNVLPTPQIRAKRSGSNIFLEAGNPRPFELHNEEDSGFSHLQFPWEIEALAAKETK